MSMIDQCVTPVILCGGAGTRLWPVSRERMPKRHRTIRSKGCLSNRTALAMVLKLVEAAQKAGDASTETTSCQNWFSE
jgi:mannose-1-phosphate guanylyltransferase